MVSVHVQASRLINSKLCLREAVFPSVGTRKSVVRPPPSIVKKIIDFCEEDMEGDETLLPTGSLNYGF